MKLLLSGDLHIGRSSSRVPETVPCNEIRAATAWSRIVELAIQEHVGLVCLSGDVADQDNKFWEAIGPLEQGIRQLAKASIRTVAVAGNHDYDVLVRLADQLPPEHFILLGRGGKWERLTINEAGRAALHIDGWSFPQRRVHNNPLASYDLDYDPAVPILGIVHGDLNVPSSPYAPLELAQLQTLAPTAWLLGHIHASRLIDGPTWVLYPGSPQALDPSETGAHGPWIVEVTGGTVGSPEQRPLSSVWYERHTINLSGAENETELERMMISGIREKAQRMASEAGPHLAHASLRLRLVGSTPISHRVADIVNRLVEELSLQIESASLGVEAIDVQTIPAIDLIEHAETQTAPGAVARMLLELERNDVSDEVAQLIRQTRHDLEQTECHKQFAQLDRREITEQMAREHLQTQGRALLTQLVTQTV